MAGKCFNCELCLSHSEIGTGGTEHYCKEDRTVVSKDEEIIFSPDFVLNKLEYDEDMQIELADKENRILQITFSKAKPIFGEAVVFRKTLEGTYYIDVIFNKKCFGDSNYLVIK